MKKSEAVISGPEPQAAEETPLVRTAREKRPATAIVIVPVLLVVITFLFWYQTWFGRKLADREMQQYLADTSVPHKTQHALSQLADRIARGDSTAKRWYPQILGLTANRETQFRSMAAWVMGQDNHSEEFHRALGKLVDDREPMVRRNAALALARFGDAAGEPQLRLMLRPYVLLAPLSGTITFRLKEGDAVRSGTVVVRIRSAASAEPMEVRSPLDGQTQRRIAKDGTTVRAGNPIVILSPAEEQVWESLRALYLVGQSEDLQDVERFARGEPGMSERVRQQAVLTARAVRRRVVKSNERMVMSDQY